MVKAGAREAKNMKFVRSTLYPSVGAKEMALLVLTRTHLLIQGGGRQKRRVCFPPKLGIYEISLELSFCIFTKAAN
jgi:hypothetical protein